MTRHLCFAALATLAFVAPTQAQGKRSDSKPDLIEIRDGNNQKIDKAPQGGVLKLVGKRFHRCPPAPEGTNPKDHRCAHPDLKVTVSGSTCMILESTWDYVTVIIPHKIRPGKRKRVEIKTKYGSDHLSIEVVDPKTFKASSKERASEGGGGRETKEMQILQSFRITKFTVVRTGAGNTFVVEGIAKGVPNKMRVQVDLRYDKQPIPNGTRLLPIVAEAFSTTFGPFSKKLLWGNYSIELLFQLGKQSKRQQRKWRKTLSKDAQTLYGRIQRRKFTQYGTGPGGTVLAEDLHRQKVRLQDHYLAHCNKIAELRDTMNAAVADAGRSFFKLGRDYNKDNYKRWLTNMKFAKDAAEAEKIDEKLQYATRAGHFKHRDYLDRFAKGQMILGLTELYKKHRQFNDQYLSPPDAKADQLGDYLLSIVLNKFQSYSKELYKHSNLPLPESIGQVAVSPVKAPKMSPKFFDAKRRELLRQVGLGSMVKKTK